MAARRKVENKNKVYIVSVKNNEQFCGIGAGGTQFAQGKARIENKRLADWFKEHEGYDVTEEIIPDDSDDSNASDGKEE